MPQYVPYLVLVPFGVCLLLMFIASIKRSVGKQVARTVSHLLSIIVAYILAPIVSNNLMSGLANGNFNLGEIVEGMDLTITSNGGIATIVAAIISPIVFIVLWILIGIVFAIVYAIVKGICFKNDKKKNGVGFLVTTILSILTAFVVGATLVMPVVGVARVVAKSEHQLVVSESEIVEDETMNELLDVTSEWYKNGAVQFMDGATGWMFDGLTKVEYQGEKGSLAKDLPESIGGVLLIVNEANVLMDAMSQINDIANLDLSALLKIADKIDCNGSSRIVGASIMQMATGVLEQTKDPSNAASEYLDIFIEKFSATTPATVAMDIRDFYYAISSLQNTYRCIETIQNNGSPEDLVENVGTIFDGLSVESAKLASKIIKTTFETSMGESDLNSEAIPEFIGDILVGIAESKETMNEEAYQAEIEVFADILDFVISPDMNKGDDLIRSYAKSEIITAAAESIVKTYGNDPFGLGDVLSDADRDELFDYIYEMDIHMTQAQKDTLLALLGKK